MKGVHKGVTFTGFSITNQSRFHTVAEQQHQRGPLCTDYIDFAVPLFLPHQQILHSLGPAYQQFYFLSPETAEGGN